MLITFINGKKPIAVLYDATVPGTKPEDVWKAVSPVNNVSFDRVTGYYHVFGTERYRIRFISLMNRVWFHRDKQRCNERIF